MRTRSLSRFSILSFVSVTLVQAQTALHTYTLPESETGMRPAVAVLDDLNGDGHAEWAVGGYRTDTTAVDAGQVVILSGIDHTILATFDGTVANGRYGFAVANVGDLSGDGVAELAVGAPGEGTVYVYSGATLSILWSRTTTASEFFGVSLAPGGDANADTQEDVIVGATGADRVYVLDGATGTTIYQYTNTPWGGLGAAVCGVGDVNGDGFDDLVASAPYTILSAGGLEGLVAVIAGPSGTLLDTILATDFTASAFDARGMTFGSSVSSLGDLDEDGIQEFAVGAPWYGWIHYVGDNWVGVFSGADRSLFWSVSGPPDRQFGNAVANPGDVDHDGFDDLLVGDPLSSRVTAFSPVRNLELFRWTSSTFAPPSGDSLAVGGDVNGDGWRDFVVGATKLNFNPVGTLPTATLLTYGCWPDAAYSYCVAAPNSASVAGALLGYSGTTSVSANDLRLHATGCPPNQFALFFYGTDVTQVPVGDGVLCVGGTQHRLYPAAPTGGGTPTHNVDMTAPPSPAGQILPASTWYFQCWYRDPAAAASGFNFSDGMRVTFCP